MTNSLYENFEKRGGVVEKGGGGNEIHAPCACGQRYGNGHLEIRKMKFDNISRRHTS
jgi:hypothetical protein